MGLIYTITLFSTLFITSIPIFLGRKTTYTLIFFLLGISHSLWIISVYFLWNSSAMLFWIRSSFLFGSLIPLFILLFLLHYPKKIISSSKFKQFLIYIPSLFIVAISHSNLIINSITSPVERVFGPGHMLFLIVYFSYVLAIFFVITRGLIKYPKIEKTQLKFIGLGFAVALIIGTTTNVILPLISIGKFTIIGPLTFTIVFIFMGYSILKYQSMGISLIVSKSISYILSFIIITSIYVMISKLYLIFVSQEIDTLFLFITISSLIITTLLFQPMRISLQSSTEKFFLKGYFDYKKVLITLTDELSSCTTINDVYQIIYSLFIEKIEISPVYMTISKEFESSKEVSNRYEIYTKKSFRFPLNENDLIIIKRNLKKYSSSIILKKDFNKELLLLFNHTNIETLIPLYTRDKEYLGCIYLGRKMTEDKLNEDDLLFLETFEKQIKTTFFRIKQSRISAELNIANKIQTEILPKEPKVKGLDICSFMKPADEVSGDYFDILTFENKSWIVVGDVAGHGISSGLTMFMVQSIMTTLIQTSNIQSPSELNFYANQILFKTLQRIEDQRPMTIVTMCTEDGRNFNISGSHDNIFIYRYEKKEIDTVSVENFPFGIGLTDLDRDIFEEGSFRLNKNDLLFIGTDGITEAPEKGEISKGQYSEKRLKEFLLKNASLPIEDIKSNLIKELNRFTKKNFQDDITFIIAKAV